MIRIVGIQRHVETCKEFVLLQNQGTLRVELKGHALLAQHATDSGELAQLLHVFSDEVDVQPSMYVLLRTCSGVGHWNCTHDRYNTYYSYMQRASGVWARIPGPIQLLSPQHTYIEREKAVALV